jgi:hypothetical protein
MKNIKVTVLFFFIIFVLKLNQMSELCNYLLEHRQVGQTTAMVTGAANYDRPFFVLGGTFRSALDICNQAQNIKAIPISIDQLSKLRGNDYPVLIDGFAVTSEIEKINRLHIKQRDLQREEYESELRYLKQKREDEKEYYESKVRYLHKYLKETQEFLNESNKKVKKLEVRTNKTRKRLKPTLEGISKLSLWDRIFNYKSKVGEIVEDYLY